MLQEIRCPPDDPGIQPASVRTEPSLSVALEKFCGEREIKNNSQPSCRPE
jgi:hypothetical protein